MAKHKCAVPHCDGTRLGHDLAVEFPEETARIDAAFDDAMDRARHPERYVDPRNLQAGSEG